MGKLADILRRVSTDIHPAARWEFGTLYSELEDQVTNGLATKNEKGNLVLYKYTRDCMFNKENWNIFTLISRGLILCPEEQRVVAYCMPKFFNYGEVEGVDIFADQDMIVTEKLDGSMGILYYHNEGWSFATSGSLNSEQSRWADEHLANANYNVECLHPGHTYIFEIIYPQNRIVVDYGDWEGISLLTAYNWYGRRMSYLWVQLASKFIGCRCPNQITSTSLEHLCAVAKKMDEKQEGYVIQFSNGVRMKIKGDEYCRLHRIISRVTPIAVWEGLMHGDEQDDIIQQLPEELQKDYHNIRTILLNKFNEFVNQIRILYDKTKDFSDKECAKWLEKPFFEELPNNAKKFVFAMRTHNLGETVHQPGSQARERVFKVFRPTNNELAGFTPSSAMNRFQKENDEV